MWCKVLEVLYCHLQKDCRIPCGPEDLSAQVIEHNLRTQTLKFAVQLSSPGIPLGIFRPSSNNLYYESVRPEEWSVQRAVQEKCQFNIEFSFSKIYGCDYTEKIYSKRHL